jgi:predicted dehydrogenase
MIRFGLIGCGRIGQRHAEHIRTYGNLVAACDVDSRSVHKVCSGTSTKCFDTAEELVTCSENIDVISVCTPNGLHARHSIMALNAGCHVVCEKPMALTLKDAGDMVNAAEQANRRLFIVKQNRFNPPVVVLRRLLEENRLGRILSFQLNCFWNRDAEYYRESWRGTQLLDGGTLFTQFSHFIDLLYWLLGDVRDIQAFKGNLMHEGVIEFEDTGVVIMRLESGAIGTMNYTVNCYKKNMEGSLTVFGERGTVKVGGQYLNELEYMEVDGDPDVAVAPSNPPNHYGTYVGSMSNHDKVYENVVNVLTNGGVVATTCFEAMKTVEIIRRIYGERP